LLITHISIALPPIPLALLFFLLPRESFSNVKNFHSPVLNAFSYFELKNLKTLFAGTFPVLILALHAIWQDSAYSGFHSSNSSTLLSQPNL
jgi:hypothetical protein